MTKTKRKRHLARANNTTTMQLSARIPDEVIDKLDRYIDGIQYRSRAQLISVILQEWIEEREVNDVENTGKHIRMWYPSIGSRYYKRSKKKTRAKSEDRQGEARAKGEDRS